MLVNRRVLMSVRMVISFAVAMALIIGFLGAPANAQKSTTANTLKVSPVRTDVIVKPGTSSEVPITVTNLTSSDVLVAPIENDFVQGDENGTPSIILDASQYAPTHSLKRFL